MKRLPVDHVGLVTLGGVAPAELRVWANQDGEIVISMGEDWWACMPIAVASTLIAKLHALATMIAEHSLAELRAIDVPVIAEPIAEPVRSHAERQRRYRERQASRGASRGVTQSVTPQLLAEST